MEFLLFRAFLVINAFNIATENPIYKYRFKVYPVDNCPMNASEFESAARRRNCTGNSRYLCAPDIYLSNLIEFCTDRNRLFYGKGNCVRLEGTGDLNHYSCVERFTSGCPTEPYQDDRIFEYPMCLAINRESKCFISEKNCPERSKEDDDRNKGKPEDYVSSYSYVIFIFMIALASVLLGTTLLIFRKEIKKRTGIKRMKNNHFQMDKNDITNGLLQDVPEVETNVKDVQEDDRNDEMEINENAVREYLSKGELTIQHIRCIIVGCARAGKTTLLSRLKNSPYEELKNIESTEIIDVHVNIFEVNKEEETIKCVDEMKKLPLINIPPSNVIKNDKETEEEKFADKSVQSKRGSEEIVQEKNVSTEESTYGISSMERREIEHYERVEDMREKKELLESYGNKNSKVDAQDEKEIPNTPDKNSPTSEEDTFLQFNENTTLAHHVDENHAVSKIMDSVKQLSNEEDLRPRITFLDFAGQSLYYAFHQIYLSPKTCYILVVDMTKCFNERSDTDEECASRFTSWTYEEYYKFWLKSIDSFSDTDAPVVVVGTHADKLSKDEGKNFFQTFYDLVDNHFDLRRHLNRKRHFTIGFPESGSNLDELKDIKKCIASLVHDPEKIKPVWAMFEHILEIEKIEKVISRKTVSNINEKISKEFRLTDSDITDMLLFLHRVGTLLYFDENQLKDTIILDIQWFAQAFKCIVAYDVGEQKNDPKGVEFLETGEIDDDELEIIWGKKDPLYLAKKKEIILYMEQLGLLAACKTEKKPFYYIPSMNKREFKDDGKHMKKSSILCFQFDKNGQLPVYLFDSIVIKCFKIPEWSILQEKGKNCIYDKVACFSYRHLIVVMCLCKFQIQVQLRALAELEIAQGLREKVQNLVEEKIKECKKYVFQIGYKCKNGIFNNEDEDSFVAVEKFSAENPVCQVCPFSKKHYLGKEICWVQRRKQTENREIKEIKKINISKWKEDDIEYVETHNFQAMLEKVRNQPFVTFVGVPGSGKTATARHIALILQAEGYEILPIHEITNIETYCDSINPQVFLIDDVLGMFYLDFYMLNMLTRYRDLIMNPAMSKSKILMTCREVVYRNNVVSDSFLTKEENVVYLHSDMYALSCEDKNALLAKYKIDPTILSSSKFAQTSLMFPYLCKIFSRNKEFKVYGPNFFISPVPIILKELDVMKSRNKLHYAALVLLMTNQNTLLEADFHNFEINKGKFYQIKSVVSRKCKVSSTTDGFKFYDALSEMEGTFVRKCGCQFMFLHELMFDITAYHFGRQFPEIMLQTMNSDYIANYIKVNSKMDSKWEKDESRLHVNLEIDLCIRLPESCYQMFAERLFRDVGDGEMYNVFTNEALKHPLVIVAFISVMNSRSYTELYATFLVDLQQMYEDRLKVQCQCCQNKQMAKLLLKLMDAHSCGIFRAISWAISFGHHQVLKFITDQILIHTGNINDLFKISFKKDHRFSDVKQGNTFNEKQTSVDITMEQCQLLCLGCCSGDLNTVQILLKYVDKDAINNTATHAKHVCLNIKPLVVACTFGYLDIAKELVKAGADVNLRDDFDSPLTAACKEGHLNIVEWLCKAGADTTL